jgi:iron complex transport system substrate-binding protein
MTILVTLHYMKKGFLIISLCALVLSACNVNPRQRAMSTADGYYARYFEITGPDANHGSCSIVSISPSGDRLDTLVVDKPMDRIICMSTSYIAYLDEIGCDSTICAVSGIRYVSSGDILKRFRLSPWEGGRKVYDIGYEADPDYERIVSLHPDVLVTYSVSQTEPQYISKLRSLGVRVFIIYDHLEDHPLGRAEYVRMFGAMTGHLREADSVFRNVRDNYLSLSEKVSAARERSHNAQRFVRKVLVNIPFEDQWYIPGRDNYTSRLVSDAGGSILGAMKGTSRSSLISVEKAYRLSSEADFWLDPGWCRTLADLRSAHPLFEDFRVAAKPHCVYNNILRETPGGGNDFWESGAARPDLILRDLVSILHPEVAQDSLSYYLEVK